MALVDHTLPGQKKEENDTGEISGMQEEQLIQFVPVNVNRHGKCSLQTVITPALLLVKLADLSRKSLYQ